MTDRLLDRMKQGWETHRTQHGKDKHNNLYNNNNIFLHLSGGNYLNQALYIVSAYWARFLLFLPGKKVFDQSAEDLCDLKRLFSLDIWQTLTAVA